MAEEEKKTDAAVTSEEKKMEKETKTTPEPGKKEEKPTEEKEAEESVEVPAQFKKLVEEVEKMTVLELNELVKVLEKKFGVSAQAVQVAAPGAGNGKGDEEQNSFSVELTAVGEQKIQVIKAVKEILGLGLKEAKDMVDGAPSMLKEDVKKEEAKEMKAKIEAVGGTITLK